MSEFRSNLRAGIAEVQCAIIAAARAGDDNDVDLHRGRLRDLLELAARNDVEVTDWVDPAVMEIANRDLS